MSTPPPSSPTGSPSSTPRAPRPDLSDDPLPAPTGSPSSTPRAPRPGSTARTGDPAGPPSGTGGAAGPPSGGTTTVADIVVAKVAGRAAREVPGVHEFGGGAARAFGTITERIPGGRTSTTQGVSVEVGERQAAIDLTVVVDYGVAIAELADALRRNVIGAVERTTGLQVVEVDITVADVHVPGV